MTAATAEPLAGTEQATWAEANHAYLRSELHRLRLLLQRRVRWLRHNWNQDEPETGRGLAISDAWADRRLGQSGPASAHDDAGAETRFYRDDSESAVITAALDGVEAELTGRRQSLTADGGLPALEALARLFGLGPFERDLALLCLAPEEDPSFAVLYAYAQDDVHARYPTTHLALSLLCPEPAERLAASVALLPSSPLFRFRLVAAGEAAYGAPQSLRPLRVDGRIADYLRGFNRLDERLAHLLRPVTPAALAGVHQEIVEGLVRWAGSASPGEPWPAFHLTGPPGAGQQAVAREFCARLGLHLYALDPQRLPQNDAERHELLHLADREAVLSRLALYLDVTEVDPVDRPLATATREWIEGMSSILFVASHERWDIQRPAVHVRVPKPDLDIQRALWTKSLQAVAHSVDGEIDDIVEQFDLGPHAIVQAVSAALGKARQRPAGDHTLAAADLWHACREQVGWRLGDLAQRLHPCYTWDDIVLPEDVFRQLREIADQVAARPLVYGTWGFGARLPRGRGISALFSGPSGTGKTMAAEILANHLRLDLYRIDLAGVISKYIGETEKNLRRVFAAAEQSGAILFFDEADSLFGKRSEVKDSHDRYANIEVNYLLQRMEEYRGLAILCTNRRSALDRAFLRRLRFLVEFPPPNWAHRRLIWQKVFPPGVPRGDLDLDALSRLEISGASIRNIALNAAFLAAGNVNEIRMEHVLHAARREYTKIDRLVTEAEFGSHYWLHKG